MDEAEIGRVRERPLLRGGSAFAVFVPFFLGFVLIGFATQGRDVVAGLWITEALAIAFPAFIMLRAANVRPLSYLGFARARPRWMVAAAVGAIANQPIVVLLQRVGYLSAPRRYVELFDAKNHMLDAIFAQRAAAMLITVAVAAPVCEELFFRGFAQPALARSFGALGGALLSGFLFALIHLDPVALLGLWEIGFLLAILRHASGSLWPCVVGHTVNNAFAGGAFVLGLQDPAQAPPAWLLALGVALGLAAIAAARRLLRRPGPPIEEERHDAHDPAPDRFRLTRAWILVLLWALAVLAGGMQLLHARSAMVEAQSLRSLRTRSCGPAMAIPKPAASTWPSTSTSAPAASARTRGSYPTSV